MSGTIVGRAAELRSLLDACALARTEGAQVVHLVGAPGVGKSALLGAMRQSLDGWTVATAVADDSETTLALAVIDQLLRALRRPRDLGVAAADADALEAGRLLIHALEPPSGRVGVVVTIDDAQWADSASLQAIAFALRRLQPDPVTVVLATRAAIPETTEAALERLLVSTHAQTLRLSGLDADGTAELLASLGVAVPDRAAVERLRAHTEGNPLHIRALAAELGNEAVSATPMRPLPAPRAFASLVLGRLAGCSPPARAVVEAAAVLGQRCAVETLRALTGIDDVATAIDEAVGRQLLVLTHDDPLHAAFPHALVRASIYHDLGLHRRADLHRRAATIAADRIGTLRHLTAASTAANPALSAKLEQAARDEAGHGRWAAAAELLSAAAGQAADPQTAGRLRLDALDCVIATGDIQAALARWRHMRVPGGPPAITEYVTARLAIASGSVGEAHSLAVRAARGCPEEDVELGARIAALLAIVKIDLGRGGAAIRWASRGVRLSSEGSLTPLHPRGTLVLALGLAGRREEALRLAAAGAAGEAFVDGLVTGGIVRLWAGATSRARVDLAEAVARGPGWMHGRITALLYLSDAEFRLGLWDDAITHGELAASLATDTGHTWLLSLVHSVASFPLAGRGAWGAAAAHAAAARREAASHLAAQIWSATAAARIAHARGDHTEVVAALTPLESVRDRDGVADPGIMPWQPLLIDALAALDRVAPARAALADLEAAVARPGAAPAGLALACARAVVALTAGERDHAEDLLRQALQPAGADDSPLDRALAEMTLGGVLRRTRRRSAARDHLAAARGRLESLGAAPYLERCEREMAALGLTPVRGATRDRDRLTPQELSVANLAAGGMSNRDIAAELVISVKTVEFHLGNVFSKLGVTSRARLASVWRAGEAPRAGAG